ncbi:MAG: hypothetical protein WBG90_06860 [Saonia sp.]
MITGNLEYLVSSLPYLSFQDAEEVQLKVSSIFNKYTAPSGEEKNLTAILDNEAEKFLTPSASDLLRQINLGTIHKTSFQQSKNKVLAAFSTYAFALKEEIRQLRMSRRNDPIQPLSKKQFLSLTPGTPLDEELQLLKLKWDKLEALSVGHYTDFGALVIYKLKLMLLLRWWSFDRDKGFGIFEQTVKKD